ncbi:MAG: hypothetical protein ACOCQD_01655 [archaeon]
MMYKFYSFFVMFLAVIFISFAVGYQYYEVFVEKRPCVYNIHSHTHAFFKIHQELLENNTPYEEGSELSQKFSTPSDMAKSLRGEIFVNEITEKEFVVPTGCHVGKVDSVGNPILYEN